MFNSSIISFFKGMYYYTTSLGTSLSEKNFVVEIYSSRVIFHRQNHTHIFPHGKKTFQPGKNSYEKYHTSTSAGRSFSTFSFLIAIVNFQKKRKKINYFSSFQETLQYLLITYKVCKSEFSAIFLLEIG